MARQSADVSTRIAVTIFRDMTSTTPRVIWAHEKPLLEEIHGEGNVNEIPLDKLDEGYTASVSPALLMHNKKQDRILKPSDSLGIGFVFTGDPAAEYQRLVEAYGKHPDIDMPVVEKVYGRLQGGAFTRLLGKPQMKDLPDQQLRSLIADYGYPGDIDKDSTPEEKKAHSAKVVALRDMPTAELLKLAADVGVEI
jgi:hypothetical protein